MKKTTTKIIGAAIAIALFSTVSCKKEGPRGPAGATGNANVHSMIDTVSTWTSNPPSYKGTISYSEITQDIIDNGAVLVYLSTGSNTYSQLPLTEYLSSSTSRSYEVETSVGQAVIIVSESDLITTNPGTLVFKVVTIAGSARKANPDLNYSNYEDVKKAFHLAD